jgi:hypothetical protein
VSALCRLASHERTEKQRAPVLAAPEEHYWTPSSIVVSQLQQQAPLGLSLLSERPSSLQVDTLVRDTSEGRRRIYEAIRRFRSECERRGIRWTAHQLRTALIAELEVGVATADSR